MKLLVVFAGKTRMEKMDAEIQNGDFITDFSGIYKVIKVESGTDYKGKTCFMMFYEPVWGTDKKYTASIPVKNLKQSGLREVLTKQEVKVILKDLSGNTTLENIDSNAAKEVVYQNDAKETIPLLKYLWANQLSIKKTDKALMEQMLENLAREIAFVTKNKFGKVKEEITQNLNKTRHQA